MNYEITMHDMTPINICYPYSPLDICKEACPTEPVKKVGFKKKEENPMASYASAQIIADTTEKDQRSHARYRTETIFYEKKSELKKQFGLIDDEAPETAADFIQRITDGKYMIPKEKLDKKTYGPERYIRWRSPDMIEDTAGYNDAKAKLETAYADAKDKIALGSASDLLSTLESFKAWSLS